MATPGRLACRGVRPPACRGASGGLSQPLGTHSTCPGWMMRPRSELAVTICWITAAGQPPARLALAMDHRVWPGRTTTRVMPRYPAPAQPVAGRLRPAGARQQQNSVTIA